VRANSFLKLVMEGRMVGKKRRGRRRVGIIDDLEGRKLHRNEKKAEGRDKCRT